MLRGTTRRLLLPVAVAAAVLSGGSALATPPAAPAFSAPVDAYARYEGQTTCASVPTPGVLALQRLVTSAYPGLGRGHLMRGCDVGGTSEHKDGRAWDWPVRADVPEQKAAADELLAWLTEPDEDGTPHARARRLGIMYVIWNGQVFRGYGSSPGWAPYSGANPHTDHVHFSLSWLGARQATSWGLRTNAATPGVQLDGDGLSLVLRTLPGAGTARTWHPSTGLSDASSLGGTVVGGLGTAVLADGATVVAGRGGDDQLWTNRRPAGGSWEGWTPRGGVLTARPAVSADGLGGFEVAVRGADGRAWVASVGADGVLRGWESAGGALLESAGPGLARTGASTLELVVLGTDGGPWRRTRSGTTWSGWSRLPGQGSGDVAAAVTASGPVLALRGADDSTWSTRLGPAGAEGWVPLGGTLSSSPALAASPQGDRVDVVVHGTDGQLWRTSSAGSGWSGWSPLR